MGAVLLLNGIHKQLRVVHAYVGLNVFKCVTNAEVTNFLSIQGNLTGLNGFQLYPMLQFLLCETFESPAHPWILYHKRHLYVKFLCLDFSSYGSTQNFIDGPEFLHISAPYFRTVVLRILRDSLVALFAHALHQNCKPSLYDLIL